MIGLSPKAVAMDSPLRNLTDLCLCTSQATRPRISGLAWKNYFFFKFLVYSGFLRSSPDIYGLVRVFMVKSGFRLWRINQQNSAIYGPFTAKTGYNLWSVSANSWPISRLFSAYLLVDQFFGLFRVSSGYF